MPATTKAILQAIICIAVTTLPSIWAEDVIELPGGEGIRIEGGKIQIEAGQVKVTPGGKKKAHQTKKVDAPSPKTTNRSAETKIVSFSEEYGNIITDLDPADFKKLGLVAGGNFTAHINGKKVSVQFVSGTNDLKMGQWFGIIRDEKLHIGSFDLNAEKLLRTKVGVPVKITAPLAAAVVEAEVRGELLWWNGESLLGKLDDITSESLSWSTPLFAEPIRFAFEPLYQLSFTTKQSFPETAFVVGLRDGSQVYGDIASISKDHVDLTSSLSGGQSLKILRSEVANIDRIQFEGVRWAGPHGALGWKLFGKNPRTSTNKNNGGSKSVNVWHRGPSNSLATEGPGPGIELPLEDLDRPVQITVRLTSMTHQPNFEFTLDLSPYQISLATWEDELVVTQKNGFIPVKTLNEETRSVDLIFYWDPKTGNGTITAPSGKRLASWTNGPTKDAEGLQSKAFSNWLPALGPPRSAEDGHIIRGVRLKNKGTDLALERLKIRDWDKAPPEPQKIVGTVAEPLDRIETQDGRILFGRVDLTEDSAIVVLGSGSDSKAKPVLIPSDDLVRIQFGQRAESKPKAEDKPKAGQAHVRFADGTDLRGKITGLREDGFILLKSPISDAPVALNANLLAQVRWTTPPPQMPDLGPDVLQLGDATLRGTWVAGGGEQLLWRPSGALNDVPVHSFNKASVRLTRGVPVSEEWMESPTLFHLGGGQILPADLKAINKDGTVSIVSPIIASDSLNTDDITALQLPRKKPITDGFGDPGWRFVKGKRTDKSYTDKKGGTVKLAAGNVWGHPSILLGDDIEFELQCGGNGALRMSLFGNGTQSDPDAIGILVAHWGNRVYCGKAEIGGDFTSGYQTTNVPSNEPLKVRLSWERPGVVDVAINGSTITKVRPTNHGKKKDSALNARGLGLRFESASLWGNAAGTVTVSNFSMTSKPGLTWVPSIVPEALEQALFLPRYRKDDPPAHVLVAHNGDILTGTVEFATSEKLRFRSRMETYNIASERAAAVVWLRGIESEEEKDEDEKKKTTSENPIHSHWVILRNGGRLNLQIERYTEDAIIGTSSLFGKCTIPANQIHAVQTEAPEVSPTSTALAGWKLKPAPEPVIPKPEGGGGGQDEFVNEDAPPVKLEMLGGGEFELKENAGKVVVLDFWATWCAPCVQGLPGLMEAMDGFDERRVVFVGVNEGEAPGTIQKFIDNRKWEGLKVALDRNQEIGKAYGVEGIPHTVIIDQNGRIVKVTTGFREGHAEEITGIVTELLESESALQ